MVLANLPFMVLGYEGWRASFTFQELRKVDITTNSIWYWGFRPESDPDNLTFQTTMDWLSPTLVLLSFAVAAAVGLWRWRRDGVYPWVGVSAAMLCGFLLLHKVHSPQYTLWLLPFFVLMQVPWRWVVGYLLVDVVMGVGFFRWFRAFKAGVDGGHPRRLRCPGRHDRRVGAGRAAGRALRRVPRAPRQAGRRRAPRGAAGRAMTTGHTAVATADESGPVPGTSAPRRPRWPAAAVPAGYLLAALLLTWSWWTPLGSRLTSVNEPDTVLFSWLLSWTPHALLDGRFPLFSDALNAPTGINLMWNNGMALPAVLFSPITALLGGVATVTVITTLGIAGSAATAFWCLRAMAVRVLPAAVGGALFGFSPAMVAQAVGGHPNLVFNVLVPVLLLLAVRLTTEERPPLSTAVLLGVTAGLQVLVGEEVLFDTGVVVGLLVLVLALGHPRTAVSRARVFAGRALVALGTFLLVAGVPLGYQLFGPLQQEGSPFNTAYYSVDLAGYVNPTRLQAIVPASAADRTSTFAGGLEEHTGYLGWPLIVIGVLALVLLWRNLRVRVALLVALAIAVLALGPELTVMGEGQGVPLPWALITWLPGFEHVITTRFALFTAAMLGAGLAFALDDVLARPQQGLRLAGTAIVALALVPLVPAPLPGTDTTDVPEFFTTRAATDLACPGGSALVLPYPAPTSTDAMLWQQAAGFSFAMPGGYFIGPGDDGNAYVAGQPSATGTLLRDVERDGQLREVTPEMRAAFVADLDHWRACAAVLGPTANMSALRDQATALIGTQPELVDGVLLWRDLSHVPGR